MFMNEVYDQQQQPGYVSQNMPAPQANPELWLHILDRESLGDTLIHHLKGEIFQRHNIFNPDTKQLIDQSGEWVPAGDPLMNDVGIRAFTPIISSIATHDKITTFITPEELNRLVKEVVDNTIYIIIEMGDAYGILPSNRSMVLQEFEHFAFFAYSASRQGTILEAIKPTYTRNESYTPIKQQGGFKWPAMLGGNSQ